MGCQTSFVKKSVVKSIKENLPFVKALYGDSLKQFRRSVNMDTDDMAVIAGMPVDRYRYWESCNTEYAWCLPVTELIYYRLKLMNDRELMLSAIFSFIEDK